MLSRLFPARYNWALRVRSFASFFTGYGFAASLFTGNWWWMLTWLVIPIGAFIEIVIEEWPCPASSSPTATSTSAACSLPASSSSP